MSHCLSVIGVSVTNMHVGYMQPAWHEPIQSGHRIITITIAGVSLGLPGFDGSSFASYQTIEDALFSLHIQLTFLAQNVDNSLLLYDAFNSERTIDFVALVIKDGYLEFRYELGSGKLSDTLDDRVFCV